MGKFTESRTFIWSRRLLLTGAVSALAAAGALTGPVLYTELACRPAPEDFSQTGQVTELNIFADYARRHIAYEQESLARVLQEGSPHEFSYTEPVKSFWNSVCAVREASPIDDTQSFQDRLPVYTAGIGFTFSIAMKGLYEESFGRGAVHIRGEQLTPQDKIHTEMQTAYAAHLRKSPWYDFDFQGWLDKLNNAPIEGFIRGWERRISLGIEWKSMVFAASHSREGAQDTTEVAKPYTISTENLPAAGKRALLDLSYISSLKDGSGILIDRRADLTEVFDAIAQRGGDFTHIDGSERVVLSVLSDTRPFLRGNSKHLANSPRQGHEDTRYLIGTEVSSLGRLLRHFADRGVRLEAIYGQ